MITTIHDGGITAFFHADAALLLFHFSLHQCSLFLGLAQGILGRGGARNPQRLKQGRNLFRAQMKFSITRQIKTGQRVQGQRRLACQGRLGRSRKRHAGTKMFIGCAKKKETLSRMKERKIIF